MNSPTLGNDAKYFCAMLNIFLIVRVQNNFVVHETQKHHHHRRNRPSNVAQINSNSNSASKSSKNTGSKFSRPESQFQQVHQHNHHQENHQYSPRNPTRSQRDKPNNCTLDVREDKTFLWRIDTQPPSYFFGTIHVPYTRVWDAVSDNAKKAFKV